MPASDPAPPLRISPRRRALNFWRQLPISRQLLLAVNSILAIAVALLLVFEYRQMMTRQLEQKRIALTEEAKTLYTSLLALQPHGVGTMQHLIDDVCARMHTEESPGHHIAAEWGPYTLQATSHGRFPQLLAAMRSAAGISKADSPLAESLVVGHFRGQAGSVYVSERRAAVVTAVREAVLLQVAAVLALASIAAIVVNAVLQRVISAPIGDIVVAVQQVANGNLHMMSTGETCQELRYLVTHINGMTAALDAADRDRRLHMQKARQIQEHLLPAHDGLKGLQVAELFHPAEDVGGDYYDVVPLSDDRYLLCLADVAGHGVPAAMAAAVIKTLVLEAIHFTQRPGEILARINRRYNEIILPGHLATMVVLVVDTRRATLGYANAGHEPPFLQARDGGVERLLVSDLLLGVDDELEYEEETVQLAEGSRVVLVSDGVTESFDLQDEQFGTARVVEILETTRGASVAETVRRFSSSIATFRGARPPMDDTTLLVAQFTEVPWPLQERGLRGAASAG